MQQLAVQRSACGRQEGSKQLGKLATLPTMWSPPELHPSQRSSSRQHQESKPNNGEESIAGTSRRAAQGHGTLGGAREGDAGKVTAEEKNVHFARGVQDCLGKEQEEDHQGQGGFGISKDFNPRLCSSAFSTKLSGMGEGVTLQPRVRESSAVPQHGRDGESSCLGCSTCLRSEQGQSDQRHGVGAGLQPAMIEEKIGKMPLRVGRGLLNMALKLNDKIHESMSNLIYNKEPVVWELFCSPESTLSQEVLKSGVRAVRINLAGGFDLYKAGTYDQLRSLWWTPKTQEDFGSAVLASSTAIGVTSTTIIVERCLKLEEGERSRCTRRSLTICFGSLNVIPTWRSTGNGHFVAELGKLLTWNNSCSDFNVLVVTSSTAALTDAAMA